MRKPIMPMTFKLVAVALMLSISFKATDQSTTYALFVKTLQHRPSSLSRYHDVTTCSHQKTASSRRESIVAKAAADSWKGEVVSNPTPEGKIQGCTLQQVEGSLTTWIITIDGTAADLGRFSDAIYKKILSDAKRERFQGFRPGTIPPHLEPTYRAFTMNECACETVLEAMQQNTIRPFENARAELQFENFSIPPALVKSKKGAKKKKKESIVEPIDAAEATQWRFCNTMKEAIDVGWRPGQSFSFVAKNVKGQRVKDDSETAGATPLGLNF